jgi:hypothetical protein
MNYQNNQLCTAHEFVGSRMGNSVECVRCAIKIPISSMANAPRCVEHYVFAHAGWKKEAPNACK